MSVFEKRDVSDRRPSPDVLLQAARDSERGRLKIFLGAAPGVGKTYEMLTNAQIKRRDGVDVVVGIVETHGRAETEALLEGLETIPRRQIDYRGRTMSEMDLDAILARKPSLVLVDELAHTNAPESRHPKRYLDVEELLAAGIDVFTTLNIQHVESLNDVVAKITGITVREQVPDSILDKADDIEIVDLAPEDLIARLNDGKIYVPEQAQRAVKHYFSPGNLTALRELALRRTAQRVDAQMVDYMRRHAIAGPWAAGERLLVGLDGTSDHRALIRRARRMADRLRAPWAVIHVETAKTARSGENERGRVAEGLRIAQRLGAETLMVPGEDVADTLIDYAQTHNFTHIVVARSRKAGWRRFIGQSVTQRLVRSAGAADVHIVADHAHAEPAPSERPQSAVRASREAARSDLVAYGASIGLVGLALGAALLLKHVLGVSNVSLTFLIAILTSAIAYGLWASLFACVVSVLAYNFFLLPPIYTFTIADPENVVFLFFFAIVALIVSNLAARQRTQAVVARQRARTTEDLYLFSRKLAGAAALDDLLWASVHQIALMLKVRVVILLPDAGELIVKAGFPPEDDLDKADLAAARWCFDHNQAAGRGADTLPGAKRLFIPLRTGRGAVGVIGIDDDTPGPLLSPVQSRLLDALSDQAAIAIERINLAQDIELARLAAETDRLRSALLTSISHDLRTPLASILGSASSLAIPGQTFDASLQKVLIATILEESERLNRFIDNLLDMTRLESGPLRPKTSLTDVSDVIGTTLERARKILDNHQVVIDLAPDLPMLDIDPVLMEQVLFNLLDNAAKYAPPGSRIDIRALRDDGFVFLQVLDEGDGVPETEAERIFDKFYRIRRSDRQRAGTGLGLPICRGFIEAMNGTIEAGNRTDKTGAVFTIKLPVPAQAERTTEVTA